jgi:hypothetical protein
MISTALFSLAIAGAAQPSPPNSGAGDELAISGFFGARMSTADSADPVALDAARLRLFIPTEEAYVQIEVETAGDAPDFLDAHLGADLLGAKALLGRFETPLTRSRLIERERLVFLDRSLVGASSSWEDGFQVSGRGQRLDWWFALQDGSNSGSEGLMGTARVAVHLIGGGVVEATEGAWGAPETPTLTIAGAFQDDRSFSSGRRAAFEAFWTYGRVSTVFEVLDNDADVGDSSPWSASVTCLIAPRLETGIRLEDDELEERMTLALTRYQQTRSSRWCVELGRVEEGGAAEPSSLLQAGVTFSF